MPKLVINKCFGGFSLSEQAVEALAKRKGVTLYWFALIIHRRGSMNYLPLDDVLSSPTLSKQHYMAMAYTTPDHADGTHFDNRPDDRADPDLVAVVEQLGERANGQHASLAVVEIPDGVQWQIEEYDGMEHVAETHRTWA